MFVLRVINCALGLLSQRRIKWPSHTLRLLSRYLVNSANVCQHAPQVSDTIDEPDIITMGTESGGFLPLSPPLSRLPAPFAQCEEALLKACTVIRSPGDAIQSEQERRAVNRWRISVTQLVCPDIAQTRLTLPVLRRLHVVFSYLVQFYVHSQSPASRSGTAAGKTVVIPASLAVPLFAVSRRLGVTPMLTYRDNVLWNWSLKDTSKPISPTNLRINTLFTGSKQEEHFMLTSLRIELRGAEALQLMERCITRLSSPAIRDSESPDLQALELELVDADLRRLATFISDVTSLFLTVKDGCEPGFFYDQIHPWLDGSYEGPDSTGWFYEGVDGEGISLAFSGASGGQSAMMHTFDAFLGVSHDNYSCPFSKNKASCASASGDVGRLYLSRMRSSMPPSHQAILAHLTHHNIRPHILAHPSLQESYDACIAALKSFRNLHIQVVTQYIVIPARAGSIPSSRHEGVRASGSNDVQGTGGVAPVPLLKLYRDETVRYFVAKPPSTGCAFEPALHQ